MSSFSRRDDWVTDVLGNAQAGASVFYLTNQTGSTTATVNLTLLVSVFSDTTGVQRVTNPLTTDGFGHANTGFPNVAAYLQDGVYSVAYVINGLVQVVLNDQVVQGSSTVNPNVVVTNPTATQRVAGFPLELPSLLLDGAGTGFTTLQAASVASGILTLPAITDMLITRTTTDVLTNKTYDTGAAGNVFKIGTALVPSSKGTANQALVMDGFGTNIIWATVGGGGGGSSAPFPDNTALVENNSDNSKLFSISVGGNTTGVNGTLACAFTTNKTLTLPDATDTIIGKATTDILTNKTFDTAGTGNVLKINGTGITAITGSGAVALATGASLTSPIMSNNAVFSGSSSGSTVLQAAATATGTLTLPAATDTLTGKATTDIFTNKTFDTAGSGNVFKINGTQITANTGTGSNVLATSPTLVTPVLGAATVTTVNGLTITSSTGTFTLTNGKTFAVSNSLTLAGTDSTTITFQGTDTYVGRSTTDTLTHKTFDTAGAGNVFKVNGVAISDVTGAGNVVLEGSPVLVTPEIASGGFTIDGQTSGATNIKTSAVAGGVVTIPGNIFDTLVAQNTTDTMTNKRITQRVVSMSDATSFTLTADTADVNTQANTQSTGTLTANAPSGTPTNGQKLMFRIKSTNVQTFSWNAIFRGSTDVPLPTASTGGGKTDYVGFIYNAADTKWDCVAATKGY